MRRDGIEPPLPPYKGGVLPLNYQREIILRSSPSPPSRAPSVPRYPPPSPLGGRTSRHRRPPALLWLSRRPRGGPASHLVFLEIRLGTSPPRPAGGKRGPSSPHRADSRFRTSRSRRRCA